MCLFCLCLRPLTWIWWTLACSGTVVIQYKSSDNFRMSKLEKRFSRSQWSQFPGKADQSRRGDLEWGGHQLSSATLALRCLLIIISMIMMLMMEVITIATLDLVVGGGHVKLIQICTFLSNWKFFLLVTLISLETSFSFRDRTTGRPGKGNFGNDCNLKKVSVLKI